MSEDLRETQVISTISYIHTTAFVAADLTECQRILPDQHNLVWQSVINI